MDSVASTVRNHVFNVISWDSEVLGNLSQRHARFTRTSNTDDVLAELLGVRLRRNNILPARPRRASQLRCHLSVQQSRQSQSRRAHLGGFTPHTRCPPHQPRQCPAAILWWAAAPPAVSPSLARYSLAAGHTGCAREASCRLLGAH